MEILGRQQTEEERRNLYKTHLTETALGPLWLADYLHEECHLWDEVDPHDVELVTKQNMGKRLIKLAGLAKESNIYELTRRLVEAPGAAPLREKT
jgi:hypothetical protein